MNEDQIVCRICKKRCKYLGSHITTKHKITAREYKEEFELPYSLPLISEEVQNRMKDKFNENREYYLKNGLKNIQKHFFQKGKDGHRRISESERKKFIERIKQVNKKKKVLEQCPICKMKYNHLESHLYNKHGLLKVK